MIIRLSTLRQLRKIEQAREHGEILKVITVKSQEQAEAVKKALEGAKDYCIIIDDRKGQE